MSHDLGDRAARHRADAAQAGDLGSSAASSSAWPASASSTGWRRARPRHVPPHRRAFHRFYREHFGLVWSMVRRLGVPSAQHEDAVQEVWLVAYRRLHTLEPDASAKAWLSTITRRVASRLRRTEHRQHRKLAALHVASERARGPAPSRIDDHDARRLVDALLAVLDEDQREALVLAQVHGLSGPEIAQVLGIPLNTAYSRLRLARRRVDRFVAEVGTEEASVIRALRRSEEPPPRAAAQVWVALVPQLGWPGAGVGTALTGALGGLAGVKTFAIAVTIGAVGLVAARGVVDARVAGGERAEEGATLEGPSRPPMLDEPPSPSHVSTEAASEAPALQSPVSVANVGQPAASPSHEAPVPAAGGSASAATTAREASERTHGASSSEPTASPSANDSAAPSPSPVTLTAEAELLARAQAALRGGDAAAALRLLEEHERRFPSGELVDERRGARVRALCELGRGAQARAEARRLLRERPDSPVAAGVADVCS